MRNRHLFLIDLVLLSLLPFVSMGLRLESFAWTADESQIVAAYAALALPIRLLVSHRAGIYRCLWRHASLVELQRLSYAAATSAVLTFVTGGYLIRGLGLAPGRMPYLALLFDALAASLIMVMPRLATRFAARTHRASGRARRPTIIVGAGTLGQIVLRELSTDTTSPWLAPVAFVDDDPAKRGQLMGGLPVVCATTELADAIDTYHATEVVIAIGGARGSVVRGIVHAATSRGVTPRILPRVGDLLSGRVKVSALRPVEIQDILRREPIVTDLEAVKELATGRTVLVTGAGGSIGSELCRQIAALEPESLVAIDHSENQMFEVESELRRLFPGLRIVPIIADIRAASLVHDIVGRHAPHAIFHAAAHKHVPLMEQNVAEAITNNVLGTRNVVDAALDASTPHFVNVSTDKAVRPTSIMGATKRIAETIVLNAALAERRNFVSVRFGNVLGSRGSVVPTFLRQVAEGGPITITHPEMRRYFMTIPEAVQLLLQAGALGSGGELFILDMGAPVKITDLARDLIRLSGLEEDVDIEIVFTGMRPGEKLYEEVLFGGENVIPTNHPKVLRFAGQSVERPLTEDIDALIRSAVAQPMGDGELRQMIKALVPEFTGADSSTDVAGSQTPLLHRQGSPPIERTGHR
ncbi:MAG TPA: nucleoside-diphosphate sugar epimerase/dehydratase [Gemmatimonadaceae bacterium]|nr:nucleoside-diphosphate sugar epimerase/dehydratase [Gemmatimonadaceae bacterium]